MTHYQKSLVVEADSAMVFAALTTQTGLRGWWTQECDAQTHVGGTIHFRFGPNTKTMHIEKLDYPGEQQRGEVRWTCIESQIFINSGCCNEWIGTELVFRLTPQGKYTRVDFEHIGLVPELECYSVCNEGWRHFLGSLQQFAKTGRGSPYEKEAVAKKNNYENGIEQGATAS